MATANITWTNNSTTTVPAPTHTVVDRVEQTSFTGLSAAPMTTRLTTSNTGDLNPLLPTGSYQDTGVDVCKNYAYRVSTKRSSEEMASLSSAHSYIYDVTNEIGYPSGAPSTAGYNVSIDPLIHVDMNRISGTMVDCEDQVYDFSGAVRYSSNIEVNINDTQTNTETARHYELQEEINNGKPVRCIHPMGNSTVTGQHCAAVVTTANPSDFLYSEDAVTIFWVVKRSPTGLFIGQPLGSYDPTIRELTAGKKCTNDVSSFSWNSTTNVYTFVAPNTEGNMTGTHSISTDNVIIAIRFNGTAGHYTANNMKYQLFINGQYIATSGDVSSRSYHQYTGGATGLWNTMFGAYRLTGTNPTTATYNPAFGYYYEAQRHGHYEYMVFPDALSATDMNQVITYACNRYGITNQTAVEAGDLIN